eukprot:CAMPEP_0202690582 /NCGR_PEP_ID=MMETSP1385-20130828/5530_1 /ASSEMBLY_ACC=CAM_ASM_000861 /TAXON_ID=933848 /ORGANISM="Elphidium margaritaceum" /LENGTH=154 /DNA_ID=CAMNT_0049345857 /DNA_START=138 /DNA_END=602 /DNA_ORIENTATION=+
MTALQPSAAPSIHPSTAPTNLPTESTPSPVLAPAATDVSSILTIATQNGNDGNDDNGDDEDAAETALSNTATWTTFNILVISGGGVLVLFIFCGFVMYARYRRAQHRKRVVIEMNIEITTKTSNHMCQAPSTSEPVMAQRVMNDDNGVRFDYIY